MTKAPIAKKIDTVLSNHSVDRLDPYYWMNNRDSKEVLDYLEAENNYYKQETKDTEAFQETLFEEMKSRIKEDDESVPFKKNGYWYITKFEKGKEYPIYTRRKETLEAPEELLFDCNQMAEGFSYFHLGSFSVSPDNKLAVYSVDTVSRRQYTLYVKDLVSGQILDDKIVNTSGSASWANDNKTLFYSQKDEQTLRSIAIYRHQLGGEKDQLMYLEEDDTFSVFVSKSRSGKFIVIGSSSTLTSEYRILNADQPLGEFELFTQRQRGLEYDISHFEDHFYILTNKDEATNFKVMRTPIDHTAVENWEDFIAHDSKSLIED
ncbi:MAG: S9 family peptidase, partial [Flavobacteriaceae bacterium]|nr:S9 family peptidase [Flavobacteriaceae bacterium]